MSQFQAQWDKTLDDLSLKLIPTDEEIKHGKEIADQIFRALQQSKKYKIDRPRIMGSIEKKTSLKNDADFDLVIYVNNIDLPLDDVLKNFDDILVMNKNLDFIPEKRDKDTNVIQKLIKGVNFDICAAISFDQNPKKQREKVLEKIRQSPKPTDNSYKYSTSLTETQVEFIRRQSSFAHKLIRLAKYWNKTLFIDGFVSGRSTLIELIAIHTAIMEEQRPKKSLFRGFNEFLKSMSEFDKLNIVFDMFYSKAEIPINVIKQKPLVLDPCNQYNNFAHFSEKTIKQFKEFANESLNRLNKSVNQLEIIPLFELFEQQPRIAPNELINRFLNPSKSWLIEVRQQNGIELPDLTIRKNKKINNKSIEIIKSYLINNIKIVENKSSPKELEKIVTEIINFNIKCKSTSRGWGFFSASHESYDATFKIPSGNCLIVLSVHF